MGRVMGIDAGEKRIGLALSDPTRTIASPFRVVHHVSRMVDAAQIAATAAEMEVELIVVGQSLDDDGNPSPQGRKAARLAEAIRAQTEIPVEMWDESFSTIDARNARIEMGVSRKKRQGHMDELAAAVILQSYLEAKRLDINREDR